MNKLTPYQYTIVHYMHDTSTREFLNIGVILYCAELKYFKAQFSMRYQRITDTFYNADGERYKNYVNSLQRRFDKLTSIILHNKQDDLLKNASESFEDLIRLYLKKESSYRYTAPTSGITNPTIESLENTLERLYETYVMRYVEQKERSSRTNEEVWRSTYSVPLREQNILDVFIPRKIITPIDELEYDYSWKNGKVHLLEPISFDLLKPGYIIEKAHRQLGKNVILNRSTEVSDLYMLLGEPKNKSAEVRKSYGKAIDIIKSDGYSYNLHTITEDQAQDFAIDIKSKIEVDSSS